MCYFRQSITKLLFSPIMVITDDAQNQSQLLHYFVKCVAEEYLKPPEEDWSPISQHKYIMQPHLEAFLTIEVGYLCVYSNSCKMLITWPLTCLGTWFSTGYTSTWSTTNGSTFVLQVYSEFSKGTSNIRWVLEAIICSVKRIFCTNCTTICNVLHVGIQSDLLSQFYGSVW